MATEERQARLGSADDIRAAIRSDLQQRLERLGFQQASSIIGVSQLHQMLRKALKGRQWPFRCQRLSERTLVVVEQDHFGEQPHIYVVRGRRKAVVIDTGCGTADLRDFFATLPELDGLVFQIVNTHIHYDHIMGNCCFCGAGGASLCGVCVGICQGARDRGFSEAWRETSLQDSVGATIKSFCVTEWLEDGERLYLDDDEPLEEEALEVMYTPGHTPDSISLYLPCENRLFTGDLLYPGSLYLFLRGSRLDEFEQSLLRLQAFVASCPPGLVLSCGHITPALPSERLLELHALWPAVRAGTVKPQLTKTPMSSDEMAVFQTPSFSLICRAEDVRQLSTAPAVK